MTATFHLPPPGPCCTQRCRIHSTIGTIWNRNYVEQSRSLLGRRLRRLWLAGRGKSLATPPDARRCAPSVNRTSQRRTENSDSDSERIDGTSNMQIVRRMMKDTEWAIFWREIWRISNGDAICWRLVKISIFWTKKNRKKCKKFTKIHENFMGIELSYF